MAVFTATRAEYGLLRDTLRAIADDPSMVLRLIVGGTHLSTPHGMTINEIISDGFEIDARVPMTVESNEDTSLIQAMAECTRGVGDALIRIRPDVLVMLGDRYELLPAASVATVLRVPIVHISGGDLTEGAIDNQVRHAVTKMAHLHFAGTQDAANRIIQMGERPDRVLVVGEPGLDEFVRAKPIARNILADSLGLDPAYRWVLFTYHPETLSAEGVDEARVQTALDVIAERPGLQALLTAANADRGGDRINDLLRNRAAAQAGKFRFVPSLGHARFVAMMREAHAIIGNSSAGLVEAASLALPAIDIGDRQKGRIRPAHVISAAGDRDSLESALDCIDDPRFRATIQGTVNPFGDGHTATRICNALKDALPYLGEAKSFFNMCAVESSNR